MNEYNLLVDKDLLASSPFGGGQDIMADFQIRRSNRKHETKHKVFANATKTRKLDIRLPRYTEASFLLPYFRDEGGATVLVLQDNPYHGLHMFGGKANKGEDPEACLRREWFEELHSFTDCEFLNRTSSYVTEMLIQGTRHTASIYLQEVSELRAREIVEQANAASYYDVGAHRGVLLSLTNMLRLHGTTSIVAQVAADLLDLQLSHTESN